MLRLSEEEKNASH